jgi:hypothetical protein
MPRQPRPNTRRRTILSSTIKRDPLAIYVCISYFSRAVKYRINYLISKKYLECVRLLRSYSLIISDAE